MPLAPTQRYLRRAATSSFRQPSSGGQTLTAYTVPAEEALKQVAGAQLDLSVNTLVTTTAIPNAHHTQKAVYKIKMRGEDPTPFFPVYPYQKVIRTGAEECQITVQAVRPVANNRSIRVDRQYLASSRYLQTNDPQVLMHVDRAARNIVDPVQVAVAMEKYVNQQLRKKTFQRRWPPRQKSPVR